MSATRRCSDCGKNWPYMSEFLACPFCKLETSPMRDTPMTYDEAKQLIAEHRLKAARAERDAKVEAADAKERQQRQDAFHEWYAEREIATFRDEFFAAWMDADLAA